jgi:hypothetical protein
VGFSKKGGEGASEKGRSKKSDGDEAETADANKKKPPPPSVLT